MPSERKRKPSSCRHMIRNAHKEALRAHPGNQGWQEAFRRQANGGLPLPFAPGERCPGRDPRVPSLQRQFEERKIIFMIFLSPEYEGGVEGGCLFPYTHSLFFGFSA